MPVPSSQLNLMVCVEYCQDVLSSTPEASSFSVTILRDPANLFLEIFNDPSANVKAFSRADNDLNVFINNPQIFHQQSDSNDFMAKNLQTFRLGFDHNQDDLTSIENAIQTLSKNFNLVLIQ